MRFLVMCALIAVLSEPALASPVHPDGETGAAVSRPAATPQVEAGKQSAAKAAPPRFDALQPADWVKFNDPKSFIMDSDVSAAIEPLSGSPRADAMAKLMAGLKSPQVEVRRRAALALHTLGDKSGVPVMMQDITTPNANDRGNVAVALLVMKDPRSIPALRRALKDSEPYVRGRALAALGVMKATVAFPEIVERLKDREEYGVCMRSSPADSAAYALAELGDPKAVPYLIAALDIGDRSSSVQICSALSVLTGQPKNNDVAYWKAWWAINHKGGN